MLSSINTGLLACFLCYTTTFLREKSKIDYGLYVFFTYLVVENKLYNEYFNSFISFFLLKE